MRLPIINVYIWNVIIIISELFIGELVLYIVIIRSTTAVQHLVLSICSPWTMARRPSVQYGKWK